MTHTDFGDLNPEITLVPIAELVPFHRRTDAGLRVKRLKEPSSSAELVLVLGEILMNNCTFGVTAQNYCAG